MAAVGTQQRPEQGTCRKRVCTPSSWKLVIRSRFHQEGKEHVNTSKEIVPAKQIKTYKNCSVSCKFNCARKITNDERERCFEGYYRLTQDRKYDYIMMTTECHVKERLRGNGGDSRRTHSFKYFHNIGEGQKVNV